MDWRLGCWLCAVVGITGSESTAHGQQQTVVVDLPPGTQVTGTVTTDPATGETWIEGVARVPPRGVTPAQPAPTPAVVVARAPAQEPPAQGHGRGFAWEASVGVPVFLDSEVGLGPGVAADVFGGWEFGYGLQVELGYRMLFTTGEREGQSLASFGYGFHAGLKYMFLNPSALVPVLGVSASVVFGRGTDAGSLSESSMLPGVHACLGAVYELSPSFGVEVDAVGSYYIAGGPGALGRHLFAVGPRLSLIFYH